MPPRSLSLRRLAAGLLLGVLTPALTPIFAGEPAATPVVSTAPAYTMSIACFSDTLSSEKREWIFVLGGVAFRSLDALKEGVSHFPKGSTLTWAPGCKRIGGEPLETEAELKAFAEHCAAHGIKFVLVPSG